MARSRFTRLAALTALAVTPLAACASHATDAEPWQSTITTTTTTVVAPIPVGTECAYVFGGDYPTMDNLVTAGHVMTYDAPVWAMDGWPIGSAGAEDDDFWACSTNADAIMAIVEAQP